MRPLRRPGEFVMQGSGLVEVGWPRGPELETGEKIVSAFVFGPDSSPKGDVEIAISQLVEVAVRAVSPSLNNPTTAISCIDKLEAALRQVAEQQADEIGWASADASVTEARAGFQPPHPMFAELLGLSFDEIRHYGRTMPSVVLRLMHALAALSTEVHDELSLDALLEQVELTIRAGQDLPEAKDRRALVELHGELVAGIQRRR